MKVPHNDHKDDKESPFLKSGPFKQALPVWACLDRQVLVLGGLKRLLDGLCTF